LVTNIKTSCRVSQLNLGKGIFNMLAILDEMTSPFVRVLMPEFVLTPFSKVCLLRPLLVPQELHLGTKEK
jgi:hypothetical protein